MREKERERDRKSGIRRWGKGNRMKKNELKKRKFRHCERGRVQIRGKEKRMRVRYICKERKRKGRD